MHMPLRLQVRGGDLLIHNHRQQLQSEAGGFLNQEAPAVRHKGCHRTHSQGSPSDIRGKQPSDNLRQRACCEPQEVNLLSEVLSAPILLGKLVHRQYLHDRDHEPMSTNSYNSSALAE